MGWDRFRVRNAMGWDRFTVRNAMGARIRVIEVVDLGLLLLLSLLSWGNTGHRSKLRLIIRLRASYLRFQAQG